MVSENKSLEIIFKIFFIDEVSNGTYCLVFCLSSLDYQWYTISFFCIVFFKLSKVY